MKTEEDWQKDYKGIKRWIASWDDDLFFAMFNVLIEIYGSEILGERYDNYDRLIIIMGWNKL